MKDSRKMLILKYMQNYGSITPKEAEKYIGCMRLAARISDLKRMGYAIGTRRKAVEGRDKTVAIIAEYYIIEEENHA